jgi:hypothetical protein
MFIKRIIFFTIGSLLIFTISANAFYDVDSYTNYKISIDWMTDNEVIGGYPDGSFQPERCVNRVEMLKMLFLANETSLYNQDGTAGSHYYDNYFSDTQTSSWYWTYLNTALSNSVVEGYPDGTFKPSRCVNRAEAIKMAILELYNGNIPPISGSEQQYLDVDLSQWYGPYIQPALANNLLGTKHIYLNEYYYPAESMTRAEVAEMLFRIKATIDTSSSYYRDGLEPNILDYEQPETSTENVTQEITLSPQDNTVGECETLESNGDPASKIDIVFFPDGGISYYEYKQFIEKIFTTNYSQSNFMNTVPFSTVANQFNFYSIWKTEDYQCADGNFDCDIRSRELAAQCPIASTYDGVIRVTKGSSNVVGAFGDTSSSCKDSETGVLANYTLSSGEFRSVNYCHGQALVNTTTSTEDVLHELGHMVGDLPHPERDTIMAYPPYYGDKFDQAEIAQLCAKISEATGISKTECTNN